MIRRSCSAIAPPRQLKRSASWWSHLLRFRASLEFGSVVALGVLVLLGSSFSTATTQEKPIYKSTGSEATIVGKILFNGKPPKPMRIDMSADPICYKVNPHPTTDWIIVNHHKL